MASQELQRRLRNALREKKYADQLLNLMNGVFTTGNTFYVSSGGSTSSATNTGESPEEALTTLALAVAKCTASQGDVIYLMPGHNESIANAQIDINVVGVTIIGLGVGAARPRFDFDHANASINVAASGCVIKNITLLPSITDVLVAIDIETGVLDTLLEDIEALPGEDGAGADDFAVVVDLKVGVTRTVVRRLKVRQHASGAGYIAGIQLNGASDDILIDDCDIKIVGAGVVAPISGVTTLSTNVMINDCNLTSDAEPGISLVASSTGMIVDCNIFSDLATIDAATVSTGQAHFNVRYVEVGNEAGTLVKTESADD